MVKNIEYMQFIGFIAVGILALFIGVFLVSGLGTAFKNIPSRTSALHEYANVLSEKHHTRSSGSVLGASAQAGHGNYYAPGTDIVSIVNNTPNTSRFREFFNKAHGATFLVEPALYTVFIPTDTAFATLPYQTQVLLNTMTDEERERFVTYYIVPQKMVAVEGGVKAGTVAALSRDYLNFELRYNGGTVGNAHVTDVYNAPDGIVYTIDTVLVPPQKQYNPAERN